MNEQCPICGADMMHTNLNLCKNFHDQMKAREFGDHIAQDDIPGVYCDPCNRTPECGECLGPDVIGEEKERLK